MSDEDYKDMLIQHDKHIDKLALSIEHIAGVVGSTNRKLEDIIDVISKQNLLMEKFSNMEFNLKESFGRVYHRIDELEATHKKGGCSLVAETEKRVEKLEINQNRLAWTVFTIIIVAMMGTVIVKVS